MYKLRIIQAVILVPVQNSHQGINKTIASPRQVADQRIHETQTPAIAPDIAHHRQLVDLIQLMFVIQTPSIHPEILHRPPLNE